MINNYKHIDKFNKFHNTKNIYHIDSIGSNMVYQIL